MIFVISVAALYTFVNAIKPLVIDDPVFLTFATHFADHPLDPYGFLYGDGIPANHVLAPPVYLYWLATGLSIFSDNTAILKLWSFPFYLILALSYYRLSSLFNPSLRYHMTALIMFSAALLPSANLMLDVPAVSLTLLGLLAFMTSCRQKSWLLCICSGVILGLSCETKYISFTAIPIILFYSYLTSNIVKSIISVAICLSIFIGIELVIYFMYGESHFIYQLQTRSEHIIHGKLLLLTPLIGILGGIALPLGVLSILNGKYDFPSVVYSWLFLFASFLLIAYIPDEWMASLWAKSNGSAMITVSNIVLAMSGMVVISAIFHASFNIFSRLKLSNAIHIPDERLRLARVHGIFLVSWLVVEILGYFLLTPFPAVRRVLLILIVLSLIVTHRARTSRDCAQARKLATHFCLMSICLGVFYFAVDFVDATAEKRIAAESTAYIYDRDAAADIRVVGLWSFRHYAVAYGARSMEETSADPPESGDWLLLDTRELIRPHGEGVAQAHGFAFVDDIVIDSDLPFSTIPAFYGGAAPIRPLFGPRRRVEIYRVPQDRVR